VEWGSGGGWHSHPSASPFPNKRVGSVGSSDLLAWGIREESSIHRSSDWRGVQKNSFILISSGQPQPQKPEHPEGWRWSRKRGE